MRIALAGNPNCGKTTLFNNLTGLRQHVGNWPGKTVEKKEGHFYHKSQRIDVVDLPGTYSLTAYSVEEIVARDYIIRDEPDTVINIIDASNLERNLYLTLQLIELGARVVLAVNMNTFAEKKGIGIDEKKLSQLLGIPVVKIEAINGKGKEELLKAAVLEVDKKPCNKLRYGDEIEGHLEELADMIAKKTKIHNPKWTALKIFEADEQVVQKVSGLEKGNIILKKSEKLRSHLESVYGEDVDAAIADARYGFIAGLIKESVSKPPLDKITLSENIDKIVTNRILGIPLFLLAMYLMFQITFSASAPIVEALEHIISLLSQWTVLALDAISAPKWVISLLRDGFFAGVGSVLVFAPIIMIMLFLISLMEDSGYMARAAFIMDKVMHKIGLHGKSFIPFILGFGCTVPSIMATRTLDNRKDRIMTMLLSPLMSCGARLPVYVLFTAAFFRENQALVIFSIYLLGILMAIIMGLIFKKTLFRGMSSPFVMELPPYRLPTLKGSLIHMWERAKHFLIKAGTVIFGSVLVIWLLSSIPFGVDYGSESSAIGIMGKYISPVFKPLGFGHWQASVSLLFGFIAKEVIVGSMGTLLSAGGEGLTSSLAGIFTPLSAYSFMVFVLLYVPCMVVIASIRKETGSWRWPAFTALYLTVLAWTVSFLVYQIGTLLGFS